MPCQRNSARRGRADHLVTADRYAVHASIEPERLRVVYEGQYHPRQGSISMDVRTPYRQVFQYLLHLANVVNRALHRRADVGKEDYWHITVDAQRLAQVVVVNLAVRPAFDHDVTRT